MKLTLWRVTSVREHAVTFLTKERITGEVLEVHAEKPVAPRRSIPLTFLSFSRLLDSLFNSGGSSWSSDTRNALPDAENEPSYLVRATGPKREPPNVFLLSYLFDSMLRRVLFRCYVSGSDVDSLDFRYIRASRAKPSYAV